MAATTLTGTTGANLLNAPALSLLVQGLQGADTISLTLADDEASGGKGFDSISITRTGTVNNTITGGEGNDTVWVRSATVFGGSVKLGAGQDSIAFATANGTTTLVGSTVRGGAGNDTLTITHAITNGQIGGGENTDLLSFTGGNALTTSKVNGGKQADTIVVFGTTTGSSSTIVGGKGFDSMAFTGAGAQANSIVGGGKGNDTLNTVALGATSSLAGGGKDDVINLINGGAYGRVYGDGVGVTSVGTGTGGAADGDDLITVSAAATAVSSIYGGGGADTINATSGFGGTSFAIVVDGGNGNDSIFIGGSAAAGGFGEGTIAGGKGDDTIVLGSLGMVDRVASSMSTIYGGDGTDLISLQAITQATAGAVTPATVSQAQVAAVISGVSGDTLRVLTSLSFSAGNTTGANWQGNAGVIWVGSTISAALTGVGDNYTGGSIGVFSDGTDSVIAFTGAANNNATVISAVTVKGVDLTITTALGAVTSSTTAFRFSVAANSGGGVDITFS